MPSRFSKIDELTRPDHTFLTTDDECYYLGEYTARRGYAWSPTNDLIQNLKKPMDRRAKPEWRYKEWAIRECGKMFREALNEEWLREATLVPVPPSKTRTHADYDDRLVRILQEIAKGLVVDLRELAVMVHDAEATHLSAVPRSVHDLMNSMIVDESVATRKVMSIGIFDDVLTTGAHFRAVKLLLAGRFPGVPIIGLFVARRTPEASDA